MAITLRANTSNNTGKGSELTYLEMDTNLESYYYSSSYASGVLYLHTTGSDTHSIDLSGFVDDLETGSLVRVSAFNTATGSFVTNASTTLNVITFTKGDGTAFNVTVDTGSGAGVGADVSALNAATGSYLYSGSYIGSNTIRLYSEDTNYDIDLTPLAGGLATDITDLNIFTGSAQTSITALNNATGSYVYSGSFDGVDTITLYSEDTNYTLDLGALAGGGSGVQPSETGSFYYSSSVNLNTITFFQGDGSSEVVTVDTGSATGGATSPGGSNTHIQFNQLGSFGGESALTYTSASQTLTIDKSTAVTAASPNIKLLGNSPAIGDLSGVIAASATTQNSAPASIKFRNASTHGLGDFSTDVILSTALYDGFSTTSERTALTLSASGDAYFSYDIFAPNLDNTSQANFVGFNTTTGELTYFSTSSILEAASLGGLTRSASATAVSFDTYEQLLSKYSISSTSGANPSANGQISVDDTDPTNVAYIEIYKTDNAGANRAAILGAMTISGSLYLLQTGAGSTDAYYRILSITDNTTYYSFQVQYMSGTGTWATGTLDQLLLDSDYVYQLSAGYNRIDVTNNSGVTRNFKFAAPTNAAPDTNIYVELFRASSGGDIVPTYMARGYGDNVLFYRTYDVYVHENSATATKMQLGVSDRAILKFTTWNIGSGGQNQGLSLVSADRVIV